MKNKSTLHAGKYLGLCIVNGWEFVSRVNASGVVVLIAVNADDALILVEQFRPALQKQVIELPAGLVGDHDDPDEPMLVAAKRELLEETGYSCQSMELVMSCPSSAGMSDEIIHFFLAHELVKTGCGGGDDSENITVHEVPLAGVDDWLLERIAQGMPVDPKIYSALYWLGQRKRDHAER